MAQTTHSIKPSTKFIPQTTMKPPLLLTTPTTSLLPPTTLFTRILPIPTNSRSSPPNATTTTHTSTSRFNFPPRSARSSPSSSSLISSDFESPTPFAASNSHAQAVEESIEKTVYRCRFLTLLGVMGSLVGSLLCFVKGCTVVAAAFSGYSVNNGRVIMLLVDAIDTYLLGTVMLVFGMGMYELFISNLDIAKSHSVEKDLQRSNLFGLFTLRQRPKWLEIKSVSELKTKLGHVIVMLLLIGLFDKCNKVVIHTPIDLLCFSASVLLSSGCLYLLSKLNGSA